MRTCRFCDIEFEEEECAICLTTIYDSCINCHIEMKHSAKSNFYREDKYHGKRTPKVLPEDWDSQVSYRAGKPIYQ